MGTHKAPLYRSKTSARYVPRRDKCVADYGYDLPSVVVREKGATRAINASFPRETRVVRSVDAKRCQARSARLDQAAICHIGVLQREPNKLSL